MAPSCLWYETWLPVSGRAGGIVICQCFLGPAPLRLHLWEHGDPVWSRLSLQGFLPYICSHPRLPEPLLFAPTRLVLEGSCSYHRHTQPHIHTSSACARCGVLYMFWTLNSYYISILAAILHSPKSSVNYLLLWKPKDQIAQ